MDLDHTIVPTKDKVASAEFFARMMGLKYEGIHGGHAPVRVSDTLTMLFAENKHLAHHHYAFHVSEEEFDAIFGRIKAEGLRYGSGPSPSSRYDMEINHRKDGRGVYFDDPNGHSYELLTVA